MKFLQDSTGLKQFGQECQEIEEETKGNLMIPRYSKVLENPSPNTINYGRQSLLESKHDDTKELAEISLISDAHVSVCHVLMLDSQF